MSVADPKRTPLAISFSALSPAPGTASDAGEVGEERFDFQPGDADEEALHDQHDKQTGDDAV